MMQTDRRLTSLIKKYNNRRILRRVIAILSCVTILLTINGLKLDADTMERIPACGIVEHVHDGSCFDGEGVLICGLEEHLHTDACYQARPVQEEIDFIGDEGAVAATDVEPTGEEMGEISLGRDEYAAEQQETLSAALPEADEEPIFTLLDRDYITLSEMSELLPLQIEEVISVLEVIPEGENEEEFVPMLRIEQIEQDYIIIPDTEFDECEIAIETTEDILIVKLTDGIPAGGVKDDTISQEVEFDLGDVAAVEEQTADSTVEAVAEQDADPVIEVPDEQDDEEAVGEEGKTDLSVNDKNDPADAGNVEPSAEDASGEDESATAEAVSEEVDDGEKEDTSDGVEAEGGNAEKENGDIAEASKDEEAEDAPSGEEADTEEENSENTDSEASEALPSEDNSSIDGDDANYQAVNTAKASKRYTATIDLAEVEVYPLSLSEIMEAAVEAQDAFDKEEHEPLPVDEVGTSVVDGPAAEPAISAETELAAEIITPAEAEPAYEDETAIADTEIDVVSDLSLLQGAEDEAQESADESNIEAGAVEAVPTEANVQLGVEEPSEVAVPADILPVDQWSIEYDDTLLSIESVEGVYELTPIADFEETVIIVNNGDVYTIILLNGKLDMTYPAQTFTASTGYVVVTVTAAEGAFPEGTTMNVEDIEDEITIDGITETVEKDFVEVERVHAVDISFHDADGAEIEPLIPINVVMTVIEQIEEDSETIVVHVDDAGETQVVEQTGTTTSAVETEMAVEDLIAEESAEPIEAVATGIDEAVDDQSVIFTADAFSVYAVVVAKRIETKVIASDGETYKIEVTYGPNAGIPDGAVLDVHEVDDEGYRSQVEAGLPGNKMITLARFFDIKIMESEAVDAEEVHPLEAVEVSVTLYDGADNAEEESAKEETETFAEETGVELVETLESAETAEDDPDAFTIEYEEVAAEQGMKASDDHIVTVGEPLACAAHFADEMSIQTAAEKEEAVTFMAEGFSVWGVVYTVDFYYGNYEWHIDGGSYMSLRELAEKLEIAEDAAAFVKDVADVVFSAPELVAVKKVENDTTVGAIRAALGLEDTEYSAKFTEEEIEEINAAEIKAVDWALISLGAFASEENLIITMKDDSVYAIKVKDAGSFTSIHFVVNEGNLGYFELSTNGIQAAKKTEKNTNDQIIKFDFENNKYAGVPATAVNTDTTRLVRWLRNDGGTVGLKGGTSWSYDQNDVLDGATYIAYFALKSDSLTVVIPPDATLGEVTNGKLVDNNSSLPSYHYSSDADPTFRASVKKGYYFKGWYEYNNGGIGSFISMDYTLSTSDVEGNRIVIPVFEAVPKYTVMVNDEDYGALISEGGAFLGQKTTYTGDTSAYQGGYTSFYSSAIAIPNENGRFVQWLKDDCTGLTADSEKSKYLAGARLRGTHSNPSQPNLLDRDTTYVAFFAPQNANLLVVKHDENGTVSGGHVTVQGKLSYAYSSENVTFTATANAGYYFKGWMSNGKCISTDPAFTVNSSTVAEDMIIEPLFVDNDVPWFELITNRADDGSDLGYYVGKSEFDGSGKSYYYGPSKWIQGGYRIEPTYIAALPKPGYDFAFWLRDDGTQGVENGFTVNETEYRGLRYDKNIFTTNITFAALFAPTGAKTIRVADPESSAMGTVTVGTGKKNFRTLTTATGKTIKYFYNTDGDSGAGVSVVATPNTAAGYEFLGWFADGKWLVSRDREYVINSTKNKNNLNLVPLFELDAAHRDFYYVYFDGSNGVTGEAYLPGDIAHGDHTMYTRYDGSRRLYGANFAYIKVNKNQTIKLPSQSGETTYSDVYKNETQKINLTRPQGTEYNNFDLWKWYKIPASPATNESASFGSEDNYLGPGAAVKIDRDMVFYADWFPTSYDFSEGVALFKAHDKVIQKDTSDFIKTYLYDYSPIFNMPSLKLNSDSTINQAGNYEYWYMPNEEGNTSRNFLFITALSDEVRTVSPRNRKQSLRNQDNETTIDGTFYSGIISEKILDTPKLKEDLFDTKDGLGKRYVGEAKNLYLYDDATGYFYYDSDKNAAKYDGAGAFVLSDEDHYDVIDKSKGKDGDFLPFNKVKKNENGQNENYVEGDGEPNYWFGMQSVITFALPNDAGYQDEAGNYGNQSTHGKDMVFKFCGDDDVWVYVDDKLFLDLGGIHGKVYGEINFSTGKIAIASNGAKKKDGAIMTYEGDSTQVQENLPFPKEIKAGEGHTLKVYYLERGSSQSNCAIYFNISPSYRVQLHKRDKNTNTELKGVTFEVYHDAKFQEPASELWWKDDEARKKYSFATGDNGLVTISGMLAGHTYYIREAKALANYPNLENEVIKLVFDAQGNATFTCTPGFAGIEPTLARKAGSNYEFVMDLWNRSKTSVTVEKDWLKADGSDGTPSDSANVEMKVKRYAMVGNPIDSLKTHTVNIVAKYYRGADGQPVYSQADIAGEPVTVKTYSYQVNDGDYISFDVLAHHIGDALAIYAVDGGITNSDTVLSSRLYGVDNTKKALPVSGHYAKSNITEDLTINVYFIGDMGNGTEADFDAYALITEPLIVTNYNGSIYSWGRNNDDWSQTVTLPDNGAWKCTLTNLDAANSNGDPYYYYVSEDSITIAEKSKRAFYTDMYSPYAVGGGTITVANKDETVQVKLRKCDPEKTTDEEKRNMPGAEFMIYTSYDVETKTGTVYQPPEAFENTHGNKEGNVIVNSVFTSDSNGNFYVGYLPVGRYYLVEIKAPEGYNMLTGPVEIIVSPGKVEYKLPDSQNFSRKTSSEGSAINVFIPNTPGYNLPSTGGPGTTLYYAAGSALILVALTLLLRRKKQY